MSCCICMRVSCDARRAVHARRVAHCDYDLRVVFVRHRRHRCRHSVTCEHHGSSDCIRSANRAQTVQACGAPMSQVQRAQQHDGYGPAPDHRCDDSMTILQLIVILMQRQSGTRSIHRCDSIDSIALWVPYSGSCISERVFAHLSTWVCCRVCPGAEL